MLGDIKDSIEIEAGRDRVWTVLTSEGLVEEWLGCIGFKPVIGALFYMQPDPGKREAGNLDGATHCEIEALEAPELMRFSWFLPGTPKTRVSISLDDAPAGRTRVSLTHSGWEQFDPEQIKGIRNILAGGWSSYVLPGLKRVSEREAVSSRA